MSDLSALERRIARVEDELSAAKLRDFSLRAEVGAAVSQSADASRLSRGASQDVTNLQEALRANLRVLEALRTTQVERAEKEDRRYAEHQHGLAEALLGVSQIVRMLENMTSSA
jgi:hypothetical protein